MKYPWQDMHGLLEETDQWWSVCGKVAPGKTYYLHMTKIHAIVKCEGLKSSGQQEITNHLARERCPVPRDLKLMQMLDR